MKGERQSNANERRARQIIVGTAGHIDHGKTALVYVLTGTDTDRLPEEKQRGITIDLGFAALDLIDRHGSTLHLSLIDVPGHHAFIRNMLAGTGGIDCVMLVIAADEGVKAQTVEHLAICSLLGIQRGIVVLTKIDAVSQEHLAETRARIKQFLQNTVFEDAPIVPVSALRGDGVAELRSALAELAEEIPERSKEYVMRLPLDRAFSIRGFGTVVTGTLQAGSLRVGQQLEQHPTGRLLRVRGLQVHGKGEVLAEAPCRVALNLAGVEVNEIGRGHTLQTPKSLSPTTVIDVEVSMLRDAPPLKHGQTIRVHAFTSETLARVLLFEQKVAAEAASGLVRLRLAKPLLLVPGDRAVLRQCSPAATVGGARVLDAHPPAALRKPSVLEWLKQLRSADECEKVRLRVWRRNVQGISTAALIAETGFTPEVLEGRLALLLSAGKVTACAGDRNESRWIAAEPLNQAIDAVLQVVAESGSLSRAEVRSKVGLSAAVLEQALERLTASGKLHRTNEIIRVAGRAEEIPEPRRRQMDAVEKLYAEAGLAPPLLSEVAVRLGSAPAAMREVITFLLRSKQLVRMGSDDAFVHTDTLTKLYSDLRLHRGETFDVGRFKLFTGLTRKHAIPLLEHLDQVRVTRNNSGVRTVL